MYTVITQAIQIKLITTIGMICKRIEEPSPQIVASSWQIFNCLVSKLSYNAASFVVILESSFSNSKIYSSNASISSSYIIRIFSLGDELQHSFWQWISS